MLISLDRLRTSRFSVERDAIIAHYAPAGRLQLGDQDVLNIYAHDHGDHLYEMSCIYNVRSDTACYLGMPVVLHGNRKLHNDIKTSYSSIYRLYSKVNLDDFVGL